MGKRSKKSRVEKKDNTLYFIAGGLVLVIGVIIFAVSNTSSPGSAGGGEFDEFATCLTESDAIFYGTEWCGFCQQQKDMFGESMDLVNFIDCDINSNECRAEGVTGYPTWKIDGQLYPGVQQFDTLADLSGCTL